MATLPEGLWWRLKEVEMESTSLSLTRGRCGWQEHYARDRPSLLGVWLGPPPPALLYGCPQAQVKPGDTWRASELGWPCLCSV